MTDETEEESLLPIEFSLLVRQFGFGYRPRCDSRLRVAFLQLSVELQKLQDQGLQ